MTNRFAATKAMGPHAPSRWTSLPVPVANEKASAIVPSDSAMSTEPVSRIGFRPTRSTRKIAISVTSTFVTLVITLISGALVMPTEFHRLVE